MDGREVYEGYGGCRDCVIARGGNGREENQMKMRGKGLKERGNFRPSETERQVQTDKDTDGDRDKRQQGKGIEQTSRKGGS